MNENHFSDVKQQSEPLESLCFDPDQRVAPMDSGRISDSEHISPSRFFDPDQRVIQEPAVLGDSSETVDEKHEITEKQNMNSPLENHEHFEGLIKNKEDGNRREDEVKHELNDTYPESQGYTVIPEAYLRDDNGNIVRDPETGEGRRIDFVVVKDLKVVDSIEVTSRTADKQDQMAKEDRIKDIGGVYIRTPDGQLCKIPSDLDTKIERRD